MIENMRKYTGLMFVVLILLAAGLIVTMQPGGSGGGGVGNEFMHVNGVALDQNDYSKAGKNSIAAIQRLAQMQNYGDFLKFTEFIGALAGSAQDEVERHLDFVTNRILLKQAAEKLGLYSAPEVAAQYIQDSMFLDRDGSHDAQLYSDYIESLSNLGFKEKDFQQFVAEYLVFIKTRNLIAGGLTPSSVETLFEDKLNRQSIGMSIVSFDLNNFKKDLAPSEEDIKAYWETHKDKYKTERQIRLTYVLTNLNDSDEPKRPTPAADADPAEVSKQNLEYQEKLAAWNEQRAAHTKILTGIFSDFVDAVDDSEGLDFDKEAAIAKEEAGEDFTIVSTEPFSRAAVPVELSTLTLKNAQPGTQLADVLFGMHFNTELSYNIDSFGVGRDGHIAIRLDEEINPVVKPFEDAKDLAKDDLITKLATEAMSKASEEAKATLTAAVAEGKTFADAATTAGFTTTEIPPFSAATAPTSPANATELFRIAQVSQQKSIAEKIAKSDNSATIIFVGSRTLELEGNEALKQTQLLEQAENQLKYVAFNAWINNLQEEAELKLPRVR